MQTETPSLTGVWKSTDKRENRHIYVTSVFGSYAYGFRCDARGRRVGKLTARETRVLLNGRGDGLARYRRPEATPAA